MSPPEAPIRISNSNEADYFPARNTKAAEALPTMEEPIALNVANPQETVSTEMESKSENENEFYEKFAEAIVNDKESGPGISRTARWAQFPAMDETTLREQKEKYDIRAKQAVLHMSLSEKRITKLEKELKKLRSVVYELPEERSAEKIGKYTVYRHEIQRSSLNEFRIPLLAVDPLELTPDSSQPALEVLITEQEAKNRILLQSSERSAADDIKEGQDTAKQDPGSDISGVSSSPERLRIRSRALVDWLKDITGVSDLMSSIDVQNSEVCALVILRPFKLLVTFEKAIRVAFQELEKTVQSSKLNEQTGEQPQQPKLLAFKTKDTQNNHLLEDVRLLIEFLDVDLKSTLELRQRIKNGTATTVCFADLWHLFELGDIVTSQRDENQLYMVAKYTGGRDILMNKLETYPETKPTPVDGFVVDCFNLAYNGSQFGPIPQRFSIRKYTGEKSIDSLTLHPFRFHKNHDTWKEIILKRSHKFLEVTKPAYAHKMYIGKTLGSTPQEVESQVIVDVALAISKNEHWSVPSRLSVEDLTESDKRETSISPPCNHRTGEGCCGGDIAHKDLDWDEVRTSKHMNDDHQIFGWRDRDILTEDDKLLLPFSVHAFVLRNRRWVTLHVDGLTEVAYDNSFDDLVLPPEHKTTVQALVRSHTNTKEPGPEATSKAAAAMDLVKGKGKGLIVLLHGEPGVGKTSTAECVADLTHRPLFPITCGDIGETAFEVQESLDLNFQLAHKWGCVLLLDEADVFLSKRNKIDLRRNAVVSVFLRTLEYYEGILFLTTNRVGAFDQAFKSRIHMSLFYDALNLDATIALYKVLLKRLDAEQKSSKVVEFKVKPKQILRFAEMHFKRLEKKGLGTWNGRQIRNAFQTAIALAEYDAKRNVENPSLGKKEFEIVAKASADFDKYLHRTLGATAAELAERDRERRDSFYAENEKPSSKPTKSKRAVKSSRKNAPDSESEEKQTEEDTDEEDDEDVDNDDKSSIPKAKREDSAIYVTNTKDNSDVDDEDEDDDDDDISREQLTKLLKKIEKKQAKKKGKK